MNGFRHLWHRLTAPRSADQDEAFHEHMTRVILLMQGAALTVFTIPSMGAWIAGAFPLENVIIALCLLVPTVAGVWWAHRGRWQTARYISPILFFALGIYLSFTIPLGMTSLLSFILAIMLTSMLLGLRAYWLALGLSLAAYFAIGVSYSQESVQTITEAMISIGAAVAGLALLQWFSISQFRKIIHDLQAEITERKQAKHALRESEEKFREFAELLPEVVFECDVQGNLSFVNKSAFDKFGYTRQDFDKGVNARQFIAPRDRERAGENIEKALRGIGEDSAEYVAQRKDDSEFPVIVFSSPIVHDGKPVGLRGIIVDITERKQAEETLRESGQFLNDVFESLQDGISVLNTDLTIRHVNGVMKRWYSNHLPLEGKRCFQCYQDANDPCDPCPTLRCLESGKTEMDIVPGLPGSDVKWIELYSYPMKDHASGEITGAIEFVRDITERTKLQAQLNQAQKMESVGRLAGGVAHDFNNMLGVILGHTEIALGQMDPTGPLHTGLQEIHKAAERSADLTRQLLAFARKQTIAPKVLDLNNTVEGMLKMLRRLIGEDIDLAWVPETRARPVKMDPSQIDQVLANLCVNARDAIKGVGKVTIETGNATFDEAYCTDHPGFLPGEYVLLTVSDDGCGMDKETLGKLFEPFFTTREMGTGLGLATVYGIVKQNNGFINVYSEPGHGTTFKVYLPRHTGKAEHLQKEEPAEPIDRGHETILLAEDEPAILNLTTTMLERQGYTVLGASTPGEAIRLAGEHTGKIHLLMTDVVMPEMNGRELAKNLLSLYPDMKRLFMSGYTADVIAHRGVLDEGVNFIQKPFAMQDLTAKVREALDAE